MQRLHWSAFACLLCAGTLVTARTLSSDEASDVELNALQQKARHLLQTDAGKDHMYMSITHVVVPHLRRQQFPDQKLCGLS